MSTVIVDYGSGNLRSAAKAFERAGRDSGHEAPVLVSERPEDVLAAERIVLPGVGAFADCKAGLTALPGMIEALREAVLERGRPFFGICVGMQLMATEGREHRITPGLGWIPGAVVPIAPRDRSLKVPHMGWNELVPRRNHSLLGNVVPGDHAYFVHSYRFQPDDTDHALAEVDYGGPVVAMIGRDNMVGTQFHPEKSQAVGLGLIAAFLAWRP